MIIKDKMIIQMQSYSPWKWNKSGKKTTEDTTSHDTQKVFTEWNKSDKTEQKYKKQNKQIVSQMQSYSNQITVELTTNKNGNLKEIQGQIIILSVNDSLGMLLRYHFCLNRLYLSYI